MSFGFWKPSESDGVAAHHVGGQAENAAATSGIARPPAPVSGPLAQQRLRLPIYRHKKQILYALEHFEVLVLVGETGCGKSTQLPQYLWEGGWAANQFGILCSQPRGVAAVTLAQRVAEESGGLIPVRSTVPFDLDDRHHHFGGKSGATPSGRGVGDPATEGEGEGGAGGGIHYVTDEMLVRMVERDPLLSSYSVVIVDDVHERTVSTDLVLGLLKQIRRNKRPTLRVVCCSATVDAEPICRFLAPPSGDGASGARHEAGCILSVDGRQHPLDIMHLATPASNYLQSTFDTCASIVRSKDPGDILCFLPTAALVEDAIRMASSERDDDFSHQSVDMLPLHGSLPYSAQLKVFTKADSKKRVIIFATSIAETSITVPGIRHVIDPGLTQRHYFDPETGLDRWIVTETSQAEAAQRAGRAGRVQPGKVYRLYTEPHFAQMDAATPPEIVRTNLTSLLLTLKAVGVDNLLAFDLMTIPPVATLSHGLESLFALGAIDDRTNLTTFGRKLSRFPVEPRISALLLKSLDLECSWDALGTASVLALALAAGGTSPMLWFPPKQSSVRGHQNYQRYLDFQSSMAEFMAPSGDHVTYANVLAEFEQRRWSERDCRDRCLNYSALKRCREIRRYLAAVLRGFGTLSPAILDDDVRSELVLKCVCAGFFFNVAKLGSDGRYYTLRKQVVVAPSPSSVLSLSGKAVSHYIIFGESVDGPRGGMELRSVSSIEAKWLREIAPHYWDS